MHLEVGLTTQRLVQSRKMCLVYWMFGMRRLFFSQTSRGIYLHNEDGDVIFSLSLILTNSICLISLAHFLLIFSFH